MSGRLPCVLRQPHHPERVAAVVEWELLDQRRLRRPRHLGDHQVARLHERDGVLLRREPVQRRCTTPSCPLHRNRRLPW